MMNRKINFIYAIFIITIMYAGFALYVARNADAFYADPELQIEKTG